MNLLNDWLFCCLTDEQKNILKEKGDEIDFRTIYQFQNNLVIGKKNIKCQVCGKEYPVMQICYNGELIQPEKMEKPKQKPVKYDKRAEYIFSDHYYAFHKKNILKLYFDKDSSLAETEEIPFKGECFQSAMSCDERFIAMLSVSGSISVIDLQQKSIAAMKPKNKSSIENYTFEFDENNRLLIFSNGRIISWDFINNKEDIIWSAPDNIRHICRNIVRDHKNNKTVFYCLKADPGAVYTKYSVMIVVGSEGVEKTVSVDGRDMLGKLCFSEKQGLYSLCIDKEIRIFDEKFQVINHYQYPSFVKYSNGGGMFGIKKLTNSHSKPDTILLSPDGRWLLLGYISELILMNTDTNECLLCVCNYDASPIYKTGFIDENSIWYTQGNSTYIQKIYSSISNE